MACTVRMLLRVAVAGAILASLPSLAPAQSARQDQLAPLPADTAADTSSRGRGTRMGDQPWARTERPGDDDAPSTVTSMPRSSRARLRHRGIASNANGVGTAHETRKSPSLSGAASTAPATSPQVILAAASASDEDDEQPADDSAVAEPEAVQPEYGVAPDFLKSLPHPPDQPRSLFEPAPPLGPPPPDLEQPYLQPDPILDPPHWPQIGWFWDLQIAGIKPHVQNELFQVVGTGLGRPIPVMLGNSPLSWTIAPRIEIGYRLPSGFGEFSIVDTGFSSNGSDVFNGPDGPAPRSSLLQMNYTDFDYHSREYTPYANWEMKWRAGVRFSESFTLTSVNETFAQAAAGSGILAAQQSNATQGVGPHFAIELERWFSTSGFAFTGKVDIADQFSIIRQRSSAITTTATPTGLDNGVLIHNFSNQVVILTVQVGLSWQPPSYPCSRLYLGYLNETWWNALQDATLGVPISNGQFDYQGIFLRASWNY